jgi:hypothetical protein
MAGACTAAVRLMRARPAQVDSKQICQVMEELT